MHWQIFNDDGSTQRKSTLSNTSLESIQFANRLAEAMKTKQIKRSPTSLQRLFNESFEGKQVTPQTLRNEGVLNFV